MRYSLKWADIITDSVFICRKNGAIMIEQSVILTPISLWEGFDASRPTKSNMLGEIRYDNVVHRDFFFSGRQAGNERVRIFGKYFTPDDSLSHECLLYIPDITERINYEEVIDYVKMGFSVLMVDFYGKRDNTENYTVYPESVSYANYETRGRRMDYVDESARETCWYEWVAVARYALTFLIEQNPSVFKIGVIGIKNGANIAWQLAAVDDRVKCAVVMFGAGWSAYKGINKFSDSDIVMNEERRKYIAAVDAHAYAQYVKCPVLFLTSTNSTEFDFDRSLDTLSRIRADVPYVFNFSPGFNVYLDDYCKKDVELFLYCQFDINKLVFPKCPEVSIEQDGNFLALTLDYSTEVKIESAKVYINEGVINPAIRNWNSCDFVGDEAEGRMKYEYVANGSTKNVFAFAVVRYKNGLTLSSKLAYKKIEPTSSKKSNLIYSSRDGLGGITFYDKNASEKSIFVDESKFLELVKGADGIYGAYSHCGLISYKFSEPCCAADDSSILEMDFFTSEFCVLKLVFMVATPSGVKEFTYSFELKSGKFWQNIIIRLNEFKSAEGMSIRKYEDIFALRIESGGKYVVNNILLI